MVLEKTFEGEHRWIKPEKPGRTKIDAMFFTTTGEAVNDDDPKTDNNPEHDHKNYNSPENEDNLMKTIAKIKIILSRPQNLR